MTVTDTGQGTPDPGEAYLAAHEGYARMRVEDGLPKDAGGRASSPATTT